MPVMDAIPNVWINAHRFGTRVLRGGEEPWAAPEQLGLFLKEVQRWLQLALVDVDVEPALVHMAARRAAPFGSVDEIVDFLGERALQTTLREGLAAVLGGNPGRPVVLSLPGAGRLVRALSGQPAGDEDALDDVAVALAGLLRQVWANALAAVLVREDDVRALALYAPLANLARHYQAPVLLAFDGTAGQHADGFAQVYDRSGAGGSYLAAEAWTGTPLADGRPIFAEIPDALTPDTVLAWLQQLRTRD